jgi:hypothetical protein
MWNEILKRIDNRTPQEAVSQWGGAIDSLQLVNWSGEATMDGINTKEWLRLILQKIMDSSWINQLPF